MLELIIQIIDVIDNFFEFFMNIMKVGVKENQNGIIFFIMVFVVEKDLMVVIEFKIKGNINQILKVKKIVFLIV